MIAPSERHLEDWIVAQRGDFLLTYNTDIKIIGRQVKLPHGILDLLIFDHTSITICELKREEITSSALAQVLRYRADLQSIWGEVSRPLTDCFEKKVAAFTLSVNCLLIGYSIDPNVLSAARGANASVFTYNFDHDRYFFDWQEPRTMNAETAREFAYGFIGEAMRESFDMFNEDTRGVWSESDEGQPT